MSKYQLSGKKKFMSLAHFVLGGYK